MAVQSATRELTDAELLVLGLVAEMPRHGYELEQEIERRGMREWTQIGFSSVYFVLGKLEKSGLVRAKKPAGARARKAVSITAAGRRALMARTSAALRSHRPTYSSLLLGMIHWPALEREEALGALEARRGAVDAEMARLEDIRLERRAEAGWIARTLEYMQTKPWPD